MNIKAFPKIFEGENSGLKKAFYEAVHIGGENKEEIEAEDRWHEEQMTNTEKRLAELAIFWQEIADNLPKSLERSALGDEKMFLAFASVYPKMAEHLEQEMLERVRELIEKKLQEVTPLYTLGDLIIGSENMQADTILGQQKVLKDLLSSLDKPLTNNKDI